LAAYWASQRSELEHALIRELDHGGLPVGREPNVGDVTFAADGGAERTELGSVHAEGLTLLTEFQTFLGDQAGGGHLLQAVVIQPLVPPSWQRVIAVAYNEIEAHLGRESLSAGRLI
jgi:hypothetical protein